MELDHVRSLQDASQYIDALLSDCEAGKYSRRDTASYIVGLTALELSDAWATQNNDYMLIVDNLASDGEISAWDADAVWPELIVTAARLRRSVAA